MRSPWVTDLVAPPSWDCSKPCGNGVTARDAYDPVDNLNRFLSGYAAPAYYAPFVNKIDCSGYANQQQRADCEAENLQRVAYYWNHGIFDKKYPNYSRHKKPTRREYVKSKAVAR